MTIGKKLVISSGSMLAVTLLLGVAALNSIGRLNTELEIATQKTARRPQLAGQMDVAGSDMLAGMRGIIMFTYGKAPAKVEMSERQFADAAVVWQKSIDEVRPLIVREDGRQLVSQLQEQLNDWNSIIQEIKRIARAGDPDGAVTIAVTKALPIYQANTRDSERFRQIQNEILAAQRASGASIYASSRWTAIGLLGLALIAGSIVLIVVRNTNRTLLDAADELNRSSEQVASAAAEISSSSQALAQGASEQAASLEETSASGEELSAMTRKNADDAMHATSLMNDTSQVVEAANQTLDQMEASMHEINASSEKIGKIIRVIDEIAFQTNILALNAAVEAARAGNAGLGFAVVADEVRNLAQRSAQAAKDTAALIEESINKSGQGKVKLDDVSHAIHSITEKSAQVKCLIEELHASSGEQARGVEQISRAISQVDQVTRTSAASAEEAASAGEELNAQAESLRTVVGRLKELVGGESRR